MIVYSLIIVFAMLTAFYSGFYFGYLKREDKAPESIPIVSSVKEFVENIEIPTKNKREKEQEPTSFFE